MLRARLQAQLREETLHLWVDSIGGATLVPMCTIYAHDAAWADAAVLPVPGRTGWELDWLLGWSGGPTDPLVPDSVAHKGTLFLASGTYGSEALVLPGFGAGRSCR